ncbi:MAG: cell division protein FtsA [Candidatus Levybacteria bacterium]|nr:cell division protein FtsA [Candidatus Levybacteria bacterium]
MKNADIVVGIDIGSSKIATLIGRIDEDIINILGVSESLSKGVKKGQIVNIEEASDAINTSLDSAERMAGHSIDRVFVSVSGVNIESQNSKGVVAVSQPDGEISEYDVERVLEAAGAVSLPSTREIIHVIPKTFTVDGEGGIKDPVGMSGVRLEVDTHIITANSAGVKNVEKILSSEAGVNVQSLVFAGLASSLSVLSDTEKELGVVLADIGAGVTNIAIYVDGSLSYTSVVPIGARHITNDLAIGLKISLESAEKIKLYLSKHYTKRVRMPELEPGQRRNRQEEDELDLNELHLPEDVKKVSSKTLVEGIIKPRLNELFTMIALEIKKSGFATQTPAGLVITGGGAKTVGAEDSAKRMLSMTVRVGVPQNIAGLIDDVESPTFATAVGLLEYSRNFRGEGVAGPGLSSMITGFKFDFKGISSITKLLKKFLPKR